MGKKIAFGLFGAGGFAREVMPFVGEAVRRTTPGADIGFYYVGSSEHPQASIHGTPVISEEEFFRLDCDGLQFNVAISDSLVRQRIAESVMRRGGEPISLQAPYTTIHTDQAIGEGAIVCPYSTINADAKIGRFFHSNVYSSVSHDCVIGDYVTFAGRVNCNGNVHVRDHAYLGTCAIIKQGTPERPLVIGEGAVIGMGAVVLHDVPPHTTVVGNPARVLEQGH